MRKSTTHRDENLSGKWSIILSPKLVSMPHSCPRVSDHCDVITPPTELEYILYICGWGEKHGNIDTTLRSDAINPFLHWKELRREKRQTNYSFKTNLR